MMSVIKAFFSGLSTKEKQVLYAASFLVCLALVDRLMIAPICSECRMLDEKISTQTKLIEKNIRILQYKDRMIDEDAAYGDYYIGEGLTQEELIALFLSEVEGMAKSSGVALVNINPVSSEEKKDYHEYSLTVECTGTMRDMLDFFYAIENAEKPLRIFSFEIAVKDREDYRVKCTVTILKLIIAKARILSAAVPPAPPREKLCISKKN